MRLSTIEINRKVKRDKSQYFKSVEYYEKMKNEMELFEVILENLTSSQVQWVSSSSSTSTIATFSSPFLCGQRRMVRRSHQVEPRLLSES